MAAAPGAACAGGSPQGALQCGPQLVGDSELATMTSGEGQSGELHGAHVLPAHGGSWPTAGHSSASAGSHGVSMPALVLSSSWDASETAAATALAGLGRLGGSAPACGTAVATAAAARGLPGSQPAPGVHDDAAAAAAAAAQAAEWSRDFVKRWRTVKKRAYLQALGLRALWQVNSPSDRHEPLELLTNDLPQVRAAGGSAWCQLACVPGLLLPGLCLPALPARNRPPSSLLVLPAPPTHPPTHPPTQPAFLCPPPFFQPYAV